MTMTFHSSCYKPVTPVKSGVLLFPCYFKHTLGGILGSSSSSKREKWAEKPFFLTCRHLIIFKIFSVTTVTKNKNKERKSSSHKALNHVTASNKKLNSVTSLLQFVTICYIVLVTFFLIVNN